VAGGAVAVSIDQSFRNEKISGSVFFEIELAVAATVMLDFIPVVYARAFDRTVLLLIAAPEPAWTVQFPEFFLVPDESPDYSAKLFLVRVELPAMLMRKTVCPF
jgi:hypothetical protein